MKRRSTLMELTERRYGERIEDLLRRRLEAGMTTDAIAVDLNISRATLWNWIRELGGEIVTRKSMRFAGERETAA